MPDNFGLKIGIEGEREWQCQELCAKRAAVSAGMKSAGKEMVLSSRLQALHAPVLLVSPLYACDMPVGGRRPA